MSNITDIEKYRKIKEIKNNYHSGDNTIKIKAILIELEKDNWTVNLHDRSQKERSAVVDYGNKTININIFKAFMSLEVLERILETYYSVYHDSHLAPDVVRYYFIDGERIIYDEPPEPDHTEYFIQTLVVERI